MARSIAMVADQTITIGTDYCLTVTITGTPDTVEVTGDMEYFKYDWRAADNEVKIYGLPEVELNAKQWRIEANWNSGTPPMLDRDVNFDVIKAAPIFGTLPDIHLYRDVPINLDIPITNPPGEIIGKTLLLGLGIDLTEEGAKVDGRIPEQADANLTVNEGTMELVAPHVGGDVMHSLPYDIESGTVSEIGAVSQELRGDFAKLQFTDVQHVIDYEWAFDSGVPVDQIQATDWHRFSNNRGQIDLENLTVTPGNLSATIQFPVVSGATHYQYQVTSQTGATEWTTADITVANSIITIIIPNLEEGVSYKIYIRVSSPWTGNPISVTVIGGRTFYSIEYKPTDNTNNELYIFHSGAPDGTTAPRIKRLLLPTSLTHPDYGGLAVNSDGDVFIANLGGAGNEKALYTFEANTIKSDADGARLTQDRKNAFPTAALSGNNLFSFGMGEYNGELYIYFNNASTAWRAMSVVPIPATDGTELTRRTGLNTVAGSDEGVSVTKEEIWLRLRRNISGTTRYRLQSVDREQFSNNREIAFYHRTGENQTNIGAGFKVIGNNIYSQDRTYFTIFRINPEVHATRYIWDFSLFLPSGLDNPVSLDALT